MSLFHEGGGNLLAEGRWLAVHEIARGDEGPYERGGHHGIAETQSRKKRLVECSDIDDALGLIEALERSEWPAAISEFAGVVVFDDPGALLARPRKKLETARHRQGDPFGKLVRGRDEHGARFRAPADALGDIDAVVVDRYRTDLRARPDERKARQRVSWILDPDFLVWTLHDTGHDIDSLLGAGRDHDLLGFASHSTRGMKIIADGFAQFRQTMRVAVAKVAPCKGSQCARGELAPLFGSARVHQCAPQIEGALVALLGDIDEPAEASERGRRLA